MLISHLACRPYIAPFFPSFRARFSVFAFSLPPSLYFMTHPPPRHHPPPPPHPHYTLTHAHNHKPSGGYGGGQRRDHVRQRFCHLASPYRLAGAITGQRLVRRLGFRDRREMGGISWCCGGGEVVFFWGGGVVGRGSKWFCLGRGGQ